jgi:hypothetical protein
VPEITFVQLDPILANAEPDPEISALIESSGGLNVALDFLPGALPFNPAVGPIPGAELCADVVWFDALVTNPDRTVQNPNILVWHGAPWLIDHGAALFIHHTWRDPQAHARRPFRHSRSHVLWPHAGSLVDADRRLAPRLDRDLVGAIVELVPDEWLPSDGPIGDPDAQRRAYREYLGRRLRAPRPFLVEPADAVA